VHDLERIVVGTAALGLPYGLPRDGDAPKLMSEGDAALIVTTALASGVRRFDTAPAYGEAEARLGRVLGAHGTVWTKVGRGELATGDYAQELVEEVEHSRLRLRRQWIDVLQWHNWTPAIGELAWFRRAWKTLRRDERIGALGASTYGPADAVAAVASGMFDLVQVEWNLLNQKVVRTIEARARGANVTIAVRSVFLQGALTGDARPLPPVPGLAAAVERVRITAAQCRLAVSHLALRAALDTPAVTYVLVGIDHPSQIDVIASICAAPPLTSEQRNAIEELDLGEDPAVDPRRWPQQAAAR
jgi:aryl-alcohol dehydrogenase-like predicted oxidoreductase